MGCSAAMKLMAQQYIYWQNVPDMWLSRRVRKEHIRMIHFVNDAYLYE